MHIASKLPDVGTTIFTVMSQLAARHGALNLGQGFPDFEGPPELFEAIARHLAGGRNQYAPMAGVPALREQIALKTKSLYGRDVDPEAEITVTSGATEALYAAFAAVLQPGDEVILLDPCYDSYAPAVELNGGRCVRIPLRLPDFAVDWQQVADSVTAKTRMLLVNSPHNPAGAVLDAGDLRRLADIVRDTRILVVSDEVYEHIVFDGVRHESVLRHDELAQRSFVISSFGKTYHCTGWKVGYCVAPAALSAEFRKVHQYLTFCTFHAAQCALADVLASIPAHYLELPAFYQAKRDFFRAAMAGSRFELLPVPGGYFQLADYSAISDQDDLAFCEWLCAQHKVAAIPLSPFYERPPGSRLVRLCFAKGEDTLAAAAERLRAV
ncbi:MAG: pyridoxal phosphate-dependent aminotransferase [Xanthomonadales bacterium]|nr:pyridoxal phosphate-dependent aminotransferase [Xanthomonadales bacterium]